MKSLRTQIGSSKYLFIEINNFIDFLAETGKKSINMIDVLRYKGIKLEQKKLRTNYHYEITKLLDCI